MCEDECTICVCVCTLGAEPSRMSSLEAFEKELELLPDVPISAKDQAEAAMLLAEIEEETSTGQQSQQ